MSADMVALNCFAKHIFLKYSHWCIQVCSFFYNFDFQS